MVLISLEYTLNYLYFFASVHVKDPKVGSQFDLMTITFGVGQAGASFALYREYSDRD